MAVKIRMKRTGAKNDACFRVVAADMRSPRDGKNLETLGWYDPSGKGKLFDIKLDRVDHWLSVGAQISDTVSSLVKKARRAAVNPADVAAGQDAPATDVAGQDVPAVDAN